MTIPLPTPQLGTPPMIDRESSWLRFNARVLEEAADSANPLLERARFLSIFYRNLDEFFMIRVSGIKHQVDAGVGVRSHQGMVPRERLRVLSAEICAALERADAVADELIAALSKEGVSLCAFKDLAPDEREVWSRRYLERVHPTLTPLAISPVFPFPFISNLALNIAVYVVSPQGERRLSRIKVPDDLPRLLPARPDEPARRPTRLLPIESLIRANLSSLFPGMKVLTPYTFRVTRDADVEIREDEADDLLTSIESELRKRRFGQAVRLEIDASAPADMVEELREGLDLSEEDVYRVRGMLDPAGLGGLADLEEPALKFPPLIPRPSPLGAGAEVFEHIRAGDVLVHHPFDSFASVTDFVRAAARDPAVVAIKQTLYRTSSGSPVIGALLEAVERGKQVAAVIELKARFDEENNIGWARRLEEAGVHVIYGVPGLKVHAKLALVVRREGDSLRRYAHVGTGNYNPLSARIYTDLGLFTCDDDMTADVADLFNRITGFSLPSSYRKMLVAPRFMAAGVLQLIAAETARARAGEPAHIVIKCNAITEAKIIEALYEASQAGVEVDLLVRGVCSVVPGVPGTSERIRVRSVVGRFLEHSRILWFLNGGQSTAWMGSADLMDRNLFRRVEVLVPIDSPRWRTWLRDVLLQRYLDDTERTRVMQSDGTYVRTRDADTSGVDVHQAFLKESGA